MSKSATITERILDAASGLGPAETRVAEFLRDHREDAMANSALTIASRIGTSDATVIRTVKELGYEGMSDLRQCLAAELRNDLSPAARFERTYRSVEVDGALDASLQVQEQSLRQLRTDITTPLFEFATKAIAEAQVVHAFGIGPSKPIADYFVIQARRFGIDAHGLTGAGRALADDLAGVGEGELLIVLAFGQAYGEALAVQRHGRALGCTIVLISDGHDKRFVAGADIFLRVQRGRSGEFSMHAGTVALLEALLMGSAALRPERTRLALDKLKKLRNLISGAETMRRDTSKL